MASIDTGGGKALAALIIGFLFHVGKIFIVPTTNYRQEHQQCIKQLNKYNKGDNMKKIIALLICLLLVMPFVLGAADQNDANQEVINGLSDYKSMTKEDINAYIKDNLDKVNLSQVPGVLRFVLGKPKINVVVKMNKGEDYVFGFLIRDNKVQGFQENGLDKPNYTITTSEDVLVKIANSEDQNKAATDAFNNGEITLKANKFFSKVKLGVAKRLFKWFG